MLCIESAMRMKGYGKTLLTWCTYKGRQRGEEPRAEPEGAISGESATGTNFSGDL